MFLFWILGLLGAGVGYLSEPTVHAAVHGAVVGAVVGLILDVLIVVGIIGSSR